MNTVKALSGPSRALGRKFLKKHALAYLLILPSFGFLATFSYYPVFSAFYHAFTNWNLATASWVGLDNFSRFFQDQTIMTSFKNQAVVTVTDIFKALFFPLLAAELVQLLPGPRSKYLFRTGFILPFLVPGIVGLMLWKSIYDPISGLLNQFLSIVGLEQLQHAWLGDQNTALGAIIALGFPFITGLNFLLFYSALDNMNHEVVDASRIDGASAGQVFRYIHVPLLIPLIKILTVLTIIGSLQNYGPFLILTNGGPGTSTMVPALTMFIAAFHSSEYGYACAIGTILFLIIITLSAFNSKLMKSKV